MINHLPPNGVFVFGSNEKGYHGRGGAAEALQSYGAKMGIGYGHVGQSYAIPTKDAYLRPLPLSRIKIYVDEFIKYARVTSQYKYYLTRIGCGYAGYTDKEIAPMFADVPENVIVPPEWKIVLNRKA